MKDAKLKDLESSELKSSADKSVEEGLNWFNLNILRWFPETIEYDIDLIEGVRKALQITAKAKEEEYRNTPQWNAEQYEDLLIKKDKQISKLKEENEDKLRRFYLFLEKKGYAKYRNTAHIMLEYNKYRQKQGADKEVKKLTEEEKEMKEEFEYQQWEDSIEYFELIRGR